MQIVKQGVATPVYVYLVDLTDGFTPETSVTSPTVYLSKNGGSAAVPSSLSWAEVDGTNMPGWYVLTLSVTDTNTPGPLGIDAYKSAVSRHFAAVVLVQSFSQSDIYAKADSVYTVVASSGAVVGASSRAAIVDDTWDELLSGHTITGSTGKQLSTASAAGDPWSTSLSAYAVGTAGNAMYRMTQGAGANLLTVTILDNASQPVEGAKVDVYNAATPSSGAFITTGQTDASGAVNFYLLTGTYYYWVYARGYTGTSLGTGVRVVVP